MSSNQPQKREDFVRRFKEVFGTSDTTEISNLLGVSYQATKNYLAGERLPDSAILLVIAEKTPFSIHWLLTGKGEKHVDTSHEGRMNVLVNDLKRLIEPAFSNELDKFLRNYLSESKHTNTDPPKTVKLALDDIWEEKVQDSESADLPVNPS